MKIFWFDTETTGLNPSEHSIVQMSGMIVVDKVTVERFNFRCAPPPWEKCEPEALKVTGYKEEDVRSWPDPGNTFDSLIGMFDKHIDKFNKTDKLIMAGHNPNFDKLMLEGMAKKLKFDYLFSYIDYHMLDTANIAMLCRLMGKGNLPKSNKLVHLCEHFKIPLEAHDSWNDIVATRKLCAELIKVLQS